MQYRFTGYFLVLSILTDVSLSAAQTIAQTAVQLPTIQRFGVSTTVVVPAGGSLSLGGVGRSSRRQNRFGTPLGGQLPGLGNRSFGRTSSAGSVAVSATIIDHQQIDRALLAEAARRRGAKVDVLGRSVADAPRQLPVSDGPRRPNMGGDRFSPWPIGARSLARSGATAEAARAETYMRRGRRAEADGQPQVAKVFYDKVARHGDASLKRSAKARLDQMSN